MSADIGVGPDQTKFKPKPRRVASLLPLADPRRLAHDGWFTADRIEHHVSGAVSRYPVDEDDLDRGRALTQDALALSGAKDEASLERLGRFHVLAAELKRLNGAERECLVDYVALSRLFLNRREIGAAIAYMRKALYVADLPASRADLAPGRTDFSAGLASLPSGRVDPLAERADRMAARLLAAEVYVVAEQGAKAIAAAQEAASLAEDLGLPKARAEAEALARDGEASTGGRSLRRCPCGNRVPYLQCCGPADEMPAEFSVKLYRTKALQDGSPYWTRASWGLELLMTPPRSDGTEHRSFYSWRVEAGRHRLLVYPNSTGRALSAARKMAALAGRDGEESEAASCAILQAVCAMEAFMAAWKLFMRKQVGDPYWPGKDRAKGDVGEQTRFADAWTRMGKAMFPDSWRRSEEDMKDMIALVMLRHAIIHSIGDAEQIVPRPAELNEHVAHLISRGVRLGPAPAPWADRVLTASVATWAVAVATSQIAYVRELHDDRTRAAEKADLAAIQDSIDEDFEEMLRSEACG